MDQVELHTAYEWVCDKCGRTCYCSGAHLDMSDEENEKALREAHGLDDWQEIPEELGGEWITMPKQVTCEHCGETYKTVDPRA